MKFLYRLLQSKWLERFRRFLAIKTGIYFSLKKFRPSVSNSLRNALIINKFKIDLVIDVGANTGQFAESLYDFGYEGRTVSFEPVKQAYETLVKRSRSNENWIIAERCAIGNRDGSAEMNVSSNTVFSSILKIKNDHAEQKKDSRVIRTEEVKLRKLDSLIGHYTDVSRHRTLLKIDTQGFEKEVLEGAAIVLRSTSAIIIEIPVHPIYENTLFGFYEIIHFMETNNFVPVNFNIEGVDQEDGKVNTLDGMFIRKELTSEHLA